MNLNIEIYLTLFFVYKRKNHIFVYIEISSYENGKNCPKGIFHGVTKFLENIRQINAAEEEEKMTKDDSKNNYDSNSDSKNDDTKGTDNF